MQNHTNANEVEAAKRVLISTSDPVQRKAAIDVIAASNRAWLSSPEYKLICEARYYIQQAMKHQPRTPKRWIREKLNEIETKGQNARPRPDLRAELNKQMQQ